MEKAYSTIEIKAVDDTGLITGIASTPSLDRVGDIMVSAGVKFDLPLPLLWQHRADQPIGNVIAAEVLDSGIKITAKLALGVSAEIDRVWALVKSGLARGLSIGFQSLDDEWLHNAGARVVKSWRWLELSVVTIPANSDASITSVKQFANVPAAIGNEGAGAVSVLGVAGNVSTKGVKMTIAQQIAALEAKRAAHQGRMTEVMQKSVAEGRTTDAQEQEEFDGLATEVQAIDADLKRFRALEGASAASATPVQGYNAPAGSASRAPVLIGGSVSADRIPAQVKAAPAEAGLSMARLMKVKYVSRVEGVARADVAREMYGESSDVYGMITKAVVPAGGTPSGNWASPLVLTEGGVYADFLEFLRPQTILGQFGQGGIPSLRQVPFNVALGAQTAGGQGYWVGEGKPIPLTKMGFDKTGLQPMKVGALAVTSQELLRNASTAADRLVRDDLANAIIARMDASFINPAFAGAAGVSPASITNGVTPIASVGNGAAEIREDVRKAMLAFVTAGMTLQSGVWIMGAGLALALSLMRNPQGAREFPDITLSGGKFEALPVIVSNHAGADYVALVSANDIYFADDGGISLEVSTEASIEMLDAALQQDALAGEGAELVSMFQTESVAFKAARSVNWKRARPTSVALISGATWGQPDDDPVGG